MTRVDDHTTMVDVKVFKTIGLYRVVWPAADRGGYQWPALLAVLWLTVGLRIVNVVRVYAASDDVMQLLDVAVLSVNGTVCMYKGYVVATNGDGLRAVLDAAAYAFTACGRRRPRELRRARARLSVWLRAYVAVSYGTLALWIAAPWFSAAGDRDPFTAVWTLFFYLTDVFVYVVNVSCWLWFDCCLMTVCFVLRAQFNAVSAGYETLGHGRGNSPPSSPSRPTGVRAVDDRTTTANDYGELISLVADNQNVIGKFDDFFDIIRPVVLIQITVGSMITITLIFLTSLAYIMGWSIVSVPVLRYFFGFASLTFQLYIYCYAFNYLETAKDMVHVAMYSSNWTAMDLKFRKTLLLAMSMNSAHKRILKVSPKSIVNLEMFARVMNMSYSTVSVLLKTKQRTAM